jgi:methionine synthase II (cobalamin-independent)
MEGNQFIDKNITSEDLVNIVPDAINYLMKEGIRCIRCGEPIWGTLESASLEKGFNQDDIQRFVNEINQIINNPSSLSNQNIRKISTEEIKP